MTITEAINKAREVAPGIADWIDDARARGVSEAEILETMTAATTLVRQMRKLEPK